MFGIESVWNIVFLLAVQAFGLGSLALVRFGDRWEGGPHCHIVFFASLLLVGLTTFSGIQVGDMEWGAAGMGTLCTMIVGATLDCRSALT
ncbi:MAG: hypothetical protein R3E01_03445 [Pirellulaceae bacterium]|nr:hypothetical protein [Planctomycetales bacterium]